MVSPNGRPARRVTGKPLFEIGSLVVTQGAIETMRRLGVHPLLLTARHASGDWGEIDPGDRGLNESAIEHGGRIMSVYEFDGEVLWIITEADRVVTTILLPSEY